MDVYREYLRTHRGRSAALERRGRRSTIPRSQTRGRRLVEPFYATFASYGLDEKASLHAQRAISAAIRGFGMTEASGRFGAEADESFAQIRLLFVTALNGGRLARDLAPAVEEHPRHVDDAAAQVLREALGLRVGPGRRRHALAEDPDERRG